MRIAITLEQCWHDVPGGTATSALESIRALVMHTDLELVGVSARHRHPPAPDFVPDIAVRQLPLPRPVLYETWHRLRWPAVQRATRRIDAIHVTGMAMPPKSAPMVVTVHDLAFVHDPTQFSRHGVRFFERAIELAQRDGDVIVCPSQATVDDCVRHGFTADRVRLVPWGIDAARVPDGTVDAVLQRYGVTRPYVFWNGTIEPRKNVAVVLEAFAKATHAAGTDLAATELVLAGPAGWNDELDRLEARIAAGAGSGGRVRRIGFVPTDHLRALHAGAEVFCFPSLREGFGLPVLEALAQGTPVITSRGTATAEIIDGSGAGLLVDPRDPDEVAVALTELLGDDARRAAMGACATERAAGYSWARCAAGLEAAYDDAIGAAT